MNEMIYDALSRYYHALGVRGYMPFIDAQKLLLLIFYKDFVFNDYRGLLSREDYSLIEQALNCLYSSTCLIPYPDYLKMGKLCLGEISEIGQRLRTLENEPVLKVMHSTVNQEDSDSDIMLVKDDTEG